ncbi:LIX1-like protein [Rhopilema esculentum]|uniref:LIX1-like protein n=1 Tax=Rhopilema esculentum TaxID=499914 RepID=UPI0031DA31AB
MLREAVDAVLKSFAKHTGQSGEVDVKEAIGEFWHAKSKDGVPVDLTYESEILQDGTYVCYVTLPGGSCFGSFEPCLTKTDAQISAAKIALMHSVFNDHPSRIITEKFIDQAVTEAKENSTGNADDNGIEAFSYMLSQNLGKSMLEFQETMTLFCLLQWNGNLKAMRRSHMKKKDVISLYSHKNVDINLRNNIAKDWVRREKKKPGSISDELKKADDDLKKFRAAGRELRFYKEKKDIIIFASKTMVVQ